MYSVAGLIPGKFLTLTAHLAICITLLWSIEESVKLCLRENYVPMVHHTLQKQLTVGLSTSIGMIAFELLAFLTGVTMFNSTSAFISIACHSSACFYLTYLVLDGWQCGWFWWIFAICSVIPSFNDFCIAIRVIINKQY